MSITKDKGVTVVTMATDRKSVLPLLCQVLKTLCCRSLCCSVHKGLMQSDVTAALGTIQILVGLFNIGLGPGRQHMQAEDMTFVGASYWLGGVFIVAGITSLLAGWYPSISLVGFAVFMNIVGSIFSIVGIVLSAVDLAAAPATRMCDGNITQLRSDNCKHVAYYYQRLLTTMNVTLIVLAALQLCVCVSVAVLGIKAVVNKKKEEVDVEDQQPQMKDILLTSPGA